MDSFIFAVNAVLPIIIMVIIGYLLKRLGFVDHKMSKVLNKLTFRLFLPSMLFLNVYNIESITNINFFYIFYIVVFIAIIFLAFLILILLFTKNNGHRGVLLQASFRSNYALIGIPLAQSLFGEKGVIAASVLSAFSIPLYNILAVISLSLFNNTKKKTNVKNILLDIVKNPLIQSIVLGILFLVIRYFFVKNSITFRISDVTPLFTVLKYLSSVATPISLIALGAQFEFSAIKELKREIIFGTITRTITVPVIAIGCALLLFPTKFSGEHYASFVALFATPVAVSSVPMTQEMSGDETLAGQLVVWTTIVSAFTIFAFSFFLRYIGIF